LAAGKKIHSLGIEFSTQSVKLAALDINSAEVAYTRGFGYDTAFSEYSTKGDVLINKAPEIRQTSPLMLIEAIDRSFNMMIDDGLDPSSIRVIKTDCMQHCTVYTDKSFEKRIRSLDPEKCLIIQLGQSISRAASPIWEDRSPVEEAAYLTESLSEQGGISSLTGNRAELRFPAAQILKWGKENWEEYRNTSDIFLLSAFVTSILAGKIAPVDTGDGWGTNLNNLDINNPGWSRELLSITDSYLIQENSRLESKIGGICHYDSPIGRISPYFVERYGINPEALILAGTGDNPATLLGCGGQTVISLGSSYTVNGVMKQIRPSPTGEYNVFGYTKGKAMGLSVFSNGGKVHDCFYKRYISKERGADPAAMDCDDYAAAAGEPSLRSDEKLMLPYLFDESLPLRKSGIIREGFTEDNQNENIRALHVSQVLSLRLHSGHLERFDELCLVGGGAKNLFLKQLISDVFSARIYSISHAAFAAPLGCAVSGAREILNISYEEAAERFVQRDETSLTIPIKENESRVKALIGRYERFENRNCGE
jgi:xylulokinase